MAPPNKPFGAVSAKAYAGAQGIKHFFAVIQPKNLGGRPPKKRKKNVLIDADTSAMTTAPDSPPDSPLIVDVLVMTKKKTRIDWEKGEHRDLLEKAISDWLKKEGDAINEQGEEILDVHEFTNKLGIPPQTFYKYICTDNRRILGDRSRGKKKWMTTDDVLFAGCVLARADRENDGLSSKEAVDMIQELAPDITRLAAHRQIICYVLPVNSAASVLKKSAQKVQATTSDRTIINVAQQYRWHRAVDEVYDLMRTKNTRLCKLSGKSFGELMPHFFIDLDEMCLMCDCHAASISTRTIC